MNAHTPTRALAAAGPNSRIVFAEWRLRATIEELATFAPDDKAADQLTPVVRAFRTALGELNQVLDAGAPLAPLALELEPLKSRLEGFRPPHAPGIAGAEADLLISDLQARIGRAEQVARAAYELVVALLGQEEPAAMLCALLSVIEDESRAALKRLDEAEAANG